MKPRSFKLLRGVHRWSGVFFAPMIVLFAVSGLLQVIDLGDYDLPEWVISTYETLEDAHQDQAVRDDTVLQPVAAWLSIAMAAALVLATLLGVVMAWVMYPKRRWVLLTVLGAGIAVPLVVLLV